MSRFAIRAARRSAHGASRQAAALQQRQPPPPQQQHGPRRGLRGAAAGQRPPDRGLAARHRAGARGHGEDEEEHPPLRSVHGARPASPARTPASLRRGSTTRPPAAPTAQCRSRTCRACPTHPVGGGHPSLHFCSQVCPEVESPLGRDAHLERTGDLIKLKPANAYVPTHRGFEGLIATGCGTSHFMPSPLPALPALTPYPHSMYSCPNSSPRLRRSDRDGVRHFTRCDSHTALHTQCHNPCPHCLPSLAAPCPHSLPLLPASHVAHFLALPSPCPRPFSAHPVFNLTPPFAAGSRGPHTRGRSPPSSPHCTSHYTPSLPPSTFCPDPRPHCVFFTFRFAGSRGPPTRGRSPLSSAARRTLGRTARRAVCSRFSVVVLMWSVELQQCSRIVVV